MIPAVSCLIASTIAFRTWRSSQLACNQPARPPIFIFHSSPLSERLHPLSLLDYKACFTFMGNMRGSIHAQVHASTPSPSTCCIFLDTLRCHGPTTETEIIHLTLPVHAYRATSILAALLVVLMLFSGLPCGQVSTYVTSFYCQFLHPGSSSFPQCSSPNEFASTLLCFHCLSHCHREFSALQDSVCTKSRGHFSCSAMSKASVMALASAYCCHSSSS